LTTNTIHETSSHVYKRLQTYMFTQLFTFTNLNSSSGVYANPLM